MTRPALFVELCAGLAALSLRLQGGKHCRPPVSRMGNKAGYADCILRVLGLRPGQGADSYLLCEPDDGCRALLQAYPQPAVLRAAAEVIRGWKDEDPRALWERLRAEGPIKALDGREVARWMMLGHCSYRRGNPESGYRPDAGGMPASETFGALSPWHVELTGNMARMCEDWPPVTICDDAREVEPPDMQGVIAYMDPPYQGTTGYGHDLSRDMVRMLATRWSDAGPTVCISKAEPIDLNGWHHVEITGERVGQKRTFGGTREWLTLNREPAWRPSVQAGMFGDLAIDTGRAR